MTEKILKALFVAGVLFLVFLGGIVASIHKTYFYRKVEEVYRYEGALREQVRIKHDSIGSRFFSARTNATGVVAYQADKSLKGYTLYTDATATAFLVDMDGHTVHQWQMPYEKAFPESRIPIANILWHGVHLFPNGDLLAVYMDATGTPYGAGLIKLDKDSHLIWKYSPYTHHDVNVAPDGTIYAILQTIDQEPLLGLEFFTPPFMHDHIAILSSNGDEIKRISVLKALRDSKYASLLKGLPEKKGDLTHVNSIRYITPEQAKVFPMAKAGDLLISIPTIGTIALLDPKVEKITWAAHVSKFQHDVSVLDNGHLLFFDNTGGKAVMFGGKYSRIVEYDPIKDAVAWSFEGNGESPMKSRRRGAVQALRNGNILITESMSGRLLEVTRAGEIVWDFYCPLRVGKSNDFVSLIDSGTRFEAKDLPFMEHK